MWTHHSPAARLRILFVACCFVILSFMASGIKKPGVVASSRQFLTSSIIGLMLAAVSVGSTEGRDTRVGFYNC